MDVPAFPDLSVVIQAGGKSARMGRDKAFVPFAGRPMIEIVLDHVAGLGSEVLIVTNEPGPYAYLGIPLTADVYPDAGPLGGIYTALASAGNPHVLIVACDMPWLNRDLLRYLGSLRATADVIVPRWDKYPEPLHAVYSKACMGPIAHNLEAGNLKITRFFGAVAVRFVERAEIVQFDPHGRSFTNINTPEDLEQQKAP